VLPLKEVAADDSGWKLPVVVAGDRSGTMILRPGREGGDGSSAGMSNAGLEGNWVFPDGVSRVLDSSALRFSMNRRALVLNWAR